MSSQGFSKESAKKVVKTVNDDLLRWDIALEHAVRLHKRGDIKKALALYRSLIESGIEHPTLTANYAVALKQAGMVMQSRCILEDANDGQNGHPNIIANLAETSRELGDLHRALKLIDRAIEKDEENLEYLRIKAAILDQLGRHQQCLEVTEHLLRLGDQNVELLCIHTITLFEVGRGNEARLTLERMALRKDLSSDDMVRLARSFLSLGETDRANRLVASALKHAPKLANAISLKVQINKEPLSPEERTTLESHAEQAEEGTNKAGLLFSLGRDSEKRGDYSTAFRLWSSASALRLENLEEKPPLTFWTRGLSVIRSEIKIQRRGLDYIPERTGRGKGRVFIVGLPRSGSTILETILNSVKGSRDLGESKAFGESFQQVISDWRKRYKLNAHETLFDVLDAKQMDEMFAEVADSYNSLTNTDPAHGKNGIVLATDKMLYNFNNVPLLARAFPGCHVIHNHRHPLDNFLSMFKENFKEGNNFSYDLMQMVEVYDAHMKIMQEAKRIFPEMVVECHYDKLVQDPPSYLEHLFSELDLQWDEAYLHDGRKRDIIRTASVVQARSSINANSLGKWKNYRKEFQPVREALEARGYVID